jgi:MoaA/NifB/PqqE/SkfB family radical SAM enzyme
MIVSGIGAKIVRMAIKLNILLLITFSLRDPAKWLHVLGEIRKKRSSIQGLRTIRKYARTGGRFFFSENIPGWPSAAFNGFFRNEIARICDPDRKGSLSTVIIAITSKCRLACGHCYEWKNIAPIEKLTPDDLKGIISRIKNTGVRHIQFSGGEPLERFDDLLDLIRFSKPSADIWILTSGFGLSRDKARLLRKAGLTGADISLDHWKEKEHNRSRNNPEAFWWAREAAKNCRDAGIVTSLSLCAFRPFVSDGNLSGYAALAREWGAGFIRLLEPRQAGRYTGKDVELKIEQTDVLESFFQNANLSDEFIDYPLVTYPGYHQRRSGCFGAGNRYLYIDSAGEIHACPFCQQSAGNALTTSFEDAIVKLRSMGCKKYELNFSD